MRAENRLLEVEGVSCSYAGRTVFSGVSLSVGAGEVVGLVGPNGCGKSTLLRLLVGLREPTEGSVRIRGRGLGSYRAKERARHVALMPQDPPSTFLTVEELAKCGARAGRVPREELSEVAHRALDRVGLGACARQAVSSLSGGQRQKAFLAAIVAQSPDIMLLDEPTSALDVAACHEVLSLVGELAAEERRSAIVVMHDLDLALRYCDRVIVLGRGEVFFDGAVSECLLEAIESAFEVRSRANDTDLGRSYSFFPR